MEETKEKKGLQSFADLIVKSYSVVRFIFIIVLTIAVGIFAVNQILEYNYKSEFLQKPCKLCAELNQGVEKCLVELNTKKLYPDGQGGWVEDSKNSIYSINTSQVLGKLIPQSPAEVHQT